VQRGRVLEAAQALGFGLVHVARLQNIELLPAGPLEGEFDFLMIEALLVNQRLRDPDQFGVNVRKIGLQGNLRVAVLDHPLLFRNGKGFDQAGNDIVALHAEDKVAVERHLGRRALRVAREDHAGAGAVVEIAEDHRLHDDGRSPLVGQAHLAAINLGLLGIPGIENLQDGVAQLPQRIIRERNAAVENAFFVGQRNLLHLLGRKLDLALHAVLVLEAVHDGVEEIAAQALKHAPGLEETPVGVPGRPGKIILQAEIFGNRSVDPHV